MNIKTAIEALEKQIPKKPINTYKSYGETYGECPNCMHTGLREFTYKHCWWCGQKIDWEK